MLSIGGDLVTERTLTVLSEAARAAGFDPDDETLAPTRREIDGKTFVPAHEYRAVLRHVFSARDETLGIALARHLPVDASGLWGFLLRSSPTYGDLLHRAARYMRAFFRYTTMSLKPCENGTRLICAHPDPSPFGNPSQEVCFFLGQWLTWGRELIGPDVAARQVAMHWPGPEDTTEIENFFGCPVTFAAAEDILEISDDLMRRPLPERTPELAETFETYAAAIIRQVDPDPELPDLVRNALAEGLLSGAATEGEIAEKLGLTRRSLRRRLADDGLTFRAIRKDVLRARAERMLREEGLPISEISYLLGYSEPSTFHRAFRGWTGKAPAEWRAEQR